MKILQLATCAVCARHGCVLGDVFSLSRSMHEITAATFLEVGTICGVDDRDRRSLTAALSRR